MPRFRLRFSDHLPDEPGGGDWESTLSQDQLPRDVIFQGSLEEAIDEANRINYQDYYGDWMRWVERDGLRVVFLAGPSCVGKGTLVDNIDKFFSDLVYSKVPAIKSKESRPKGPRYDEESLWDNPRYFRTAEELKRMEYERDHMPSRRRDLQLDNYLFGDCRGLPQAINLDEVLGAEHDIVLVEAYHTLWPQLRDLKGVLYGSDKIGVFVSPVSEREIEEWKSQGIELEPKIREIMCDKLKVRTEYPGEAPDDPEVYRSNMERAGSTYSELQRAHTYTHILVNKWDRLPDGKFTARPTGDAWKAVEAFAEILRTGNSQYAEHWKPDTV